MAIETPESIGRWIAETFPGADPESPRMAIRLLEEAVELCLESGASGVEIENAAHKAIGKALVKSGVHYFVGRRNPEKIPKESADVYIVNCGIAYLLKFSLDDTADAKMVVNRSREWETLGDGTGYHVRKIGDP